MSIDSNAPLIRFGCPSCGTTIRAKPDMTGRTAKCPKCATSLTVPGGQPSPIAPSTGPARATNQPPQPPAVLTELLEICRKSRDKHWLVPWRTQLKVGEDIPDLWRQRCRKNFKIPPGDELIALVDATGLFFKGSYGFVITDSGVRWLSVPYPPWKTVLFGLGRKRAFTWAELVQTPLRIETGILNIFRNDLVFGDFFTRFYCGTKFSNQQLFELLLELQEWASTRASGPRA